MPEVIATSGFAFLKLILTFAAQRTNGRFTNNLLTLIIYPYSISL